MPTLELTRKIRPTRRPAAAMGDMLLQAIMALCVALVVVTIVAYPTTEPLDSAVYSVAGP